MPPLCVQKGALGRVNTEDGAKSKMSYWNAVPGPVPGVGRCGVAGVVGCELLWFQL